MDTIKTLCFNPHLLLPFRSSSPFWLMGHKSLFDVVCSVRLLFFYFPLSGLAVNLRRPFDIHLLQADLSDPGFFFSLHAINLCRFRENSCHSGQWQYCSFPCMFPPTAETSTVTPGGCVPDVPSGWHCPIETCWMSCVCVRQSTVSNAYESDCCCKWKCGVLHG